ncbi:hypothetical protein J6590_089880, partial [Homalodisca vitripennis]
YMSSAVLLNSSSFDIRHSPSVCGFALVIIWDTTGGSINNVKEDTLSDKQFRWMLQLKHCGKSWDAYLIDCPCAII